MISPKAREALLAAHDLHRASAAVQDAADAGPDVIDEALYAELRRLAGPDSLIGLPSFPSGLPP